MDTNSHERGTCKRSVAAAVSPRHSAECAPIDVVGYGLLTWTPPPLTPSRSVFICVNPWLNAFLALLMGFFVSAARAADICWSEPVPIAGDSDVVVFGELDRACNFGSAEPVALVNGVPFKFFGANTGPADGPGSLTDGRTTLVISGDGDGFGFESAALLSPSLELSRDYGALLRSGVHNRGWPAAVMLGGLTVGTTYLVQLWAHDSRSVPTTQILTGGANTSAAFKLNSTETAAGRGSHILGLFTADASEQVMTCTPMGGGAVFNALQLRVAPDGGGLMMIRRPESVTNYVNRASGLRVVALGPSRLSYQWQKLKADSAVDLVDDVRISGTRQSALNFSSLTLDDAGLYCVRISTPDGVVRSDAVTLAVLEPGENPLINVAVNNGSTAPFKGVAVLAGTPADMWNSMDARRPFANVPLANAMGETTPVTLTLAKPDGGAVRNSLLGSVSFATRQTATLSNLPPDELFHLVVFSVGNMPGEGGVFTGAVEGVCAGYPAANVPATRFIYGTNYVENPYARSDANGALSFDIAPTRTVTAGGHDNGDFNGLQLMRTKPGPPVILQSPGAACVYPGRPVTLAVRTASPPGLPVVYQWQRVTPNNTNDVADGRGVSGATTSRLDFGAITPEQAGDYRVVVSNELGTAVSRPANVYVLTNALINVAINNGSLPARAGVAVLPGTPDDVWNSVDARKSFADVLLKDSQGNTTPVTLSLDRPDGGAVRNSLLGAVSFGSSQTVTLSNLPPDESYRLVVFSVGNMPNEGGVFSGAIEGVCRGYPKANTPATVFMSGTNYLEAPYVTSDARGVIMFTVKPNSTMMAGGHTYGDFNGLQLMKMPPGPPVIVQQPESVKAFPRTPVNLRVRAWGPPRSSLTYRWQKVTATATNNLAPGPNLAGITSGHLNIRSLTGADLGDYRVVVANEFGAVTSELATVTMTTRQLINVGVSSGSSPPCAGTAVLEGGPADVWNNIDARTAFSNIALMDSEGALTPVTLTLAKTNGGAVGNQLLGAVSFGTTQTVTLSNLPPNDTYHLVVFSVGNMANEGGVFSGAIEGMCEGYPQANTPATEFIPGVNYLDNPEAVSDAQGVITFTIQPNATAMPGGHFYGDFNGLQLLRTVSAPAPRRLLTR